jgi:hypothetical protein
MKILTEYNNNHFNYYFNKIDLFNENGLEINSWIKLLNNRELFFWIKICLFIKNSSTLHLHINIKAITFVLKMFLIELDINLSLVTSFNDDYKHIIINRFYKILLYEYSYRRKLINKKITYTLLKNINQH